MKRKLWFLLLPVFLLAMVLAIPARAETYSGTFAYGSSVTWSMDTETGVLTISGEGTIGGRHYVSEHVLSDEIPWKSYSSQVKTLVVEEGITRIMSKTFFDLYNCTRIELPSTVSFISSGGSSYSDGYNMVQHALPDTVQEIVVAEGNPYFKVEDGVLLGLDSVSGDPVRVIRYLTGSTATTYTIPETVTQIDHAAFRGESDLVQVTMGDGVTSIGEEAFRSCHKLENISLPSGLTKISAFTFDHCDKLKSVTIPEGVTTLGKYAFSYCESLAQAEIPENVTSIGAYCFYKSGLVSADIPSAVEKIAEYAFSECPELAEVKFAAGAEKTIGKYAFSNCAVTALDLPDGLTSLGTYAFYNCSVLRTVTLPESLSSIGTSAFSSCDALQTITLPKGLTTLGGNPFNYCESLTAIEVAAGNSAFTSADGVLYTADMTTLLCYPAGKTDTIWSVPAGVTALKEYAFTRNDFIAEVYLPSGMATIPKYSFYLCTGLQGLYFYGNAPEEVTGAVYDPSSTTAVIYYIEGNEGWGETWNDLPTAVWTPETEATYTVTYDANGGTNAPVAQTKTGGVALVLSDLSPSRDGHTFMGWAASGDAASAVWQPGSLYTEDADVTLYAVWKANTYTVRFDANGGAGAPEAVTKTYGEALTLPETVPTRTYYEFLGWSASASSVRPSWLAGGSYTANGDTTLYAVWQAVTYTVTYNANGGAGAPEAQTKTAGVDLILSGEVPTRAGFTFLGWATGASAAEAEYQPESTYTGNADLTLYALWQQTVTGEDGAVILSSAVARPGETVTLTASISNNQGMAGFLFEIRANTDVFSVASTDGELNVTAGTVCKSGTLLANTSENGWKVMWYHTNNVTTNGDLFTIELTVAEDATDGEYTVELVCSADDTVTVNGDLVPLAVTGGTVTVAGGVKGDVNGDGKVTNSDVIRLARHLVGLTTLTEEQLVWADANGDGKITNSDVIKLARYLVGLTTLE